MHPLYVDISDEITTVIERLKAAPETSVALVVPKGASLIQSIVNLKLAKRAAQESGKELVLVTTDKIGRNLAGQVGISAVANLDESLVTESATEEAGGEPKIIDGVKVHRYYDDQDPAAPAEDDGPTPEPIVPRQILKEASAPEPAPVITVRKIEQEVPAAPKKDTVPAAAPDLVAVPPTPVMAAAVTPALVETVAPKVLPENKRPEQPPSVPPTEPRPRRRTLGRLLVYLFILSLLAGAGASAFYYPQTTVTVQVAAEAWEKQVTVNAAINGAPAAELITIEGDDSVQQKATGTKELGEKAQGTAKLFNTDSSDAKTLPAGSKIVAGSIIFITQKEARVPGARIQSGQVVSGTVSVDIIAEAAGTAGNLADTSATVQDQKLLAQIVSTLGGTSKQVAVVTQTDIANAKAALQKKARESVDAKMTAGLQNRDALFDAKTDSFAFENFVAATAAGAEAENVTVTGKGILKRLVTDCSTALEAVTSALKSQQEPDTTYQTDDVTVTSWNVNMKDQTIAIAATAKGRKAASVATDSLREDLVGKSRPGGEDIIQASVRNGKVTIEQSPTWWPTRNFPYSDRFITVRVTYE